MQRAIELAVQAQGFVSPNPLVGCVILRDSQIVAEGWHKNFGDPHAEAQALASIHGPLDSTTLVCTLEPCSHIGRNPSCADTIIAAGIRRVVVGCTDPNPLVQGRGIARMRAAGIEVIENVLEKECRWMNRFFLKSITEKAPYSILKVAQTIDSRVSAAQGERLQLSCRESQIRLHELRAQCDAVIVGADTAIIDNPQLNVRFSSGRDPVRVVIDSQLRCPTNLQLFSDTNAASTIVCCSSSMQGTAQALSLQAKGVRFVFAVPEVTGHLNLHHCLEQLYSQYSICSVLIEAGSKLSKACIDQRCVDELMLIVTPVLLGNGPIAFDGGLVQDPMEQTFHLQSVQISGADCHILMTTKQ